MKKIFILLTGILALNAKAQPIISKWKMNNNGELASYWQNTNGSPNNPTFVFNTSTSLADVTKVCYDTSYVWIKSEGMTVNMGKFLNPGAPSAQNYTFRLPRKPTVPVTKTTSPLVGAIGILINGVPIYGLSNAHYYNGSGNNGMGVGTWNVEVYLSEGFVLDTTLGAHPQQQGAYHTHAKPYRLFSSTASNVHSPLIGFAFDGNPVYGPYGYSVATDNLSTVSRMKTGFTLRNITTRTSLPDGTALTAANYGPAVNSTYPLGTYSEDYEWLLSNGGDLDIYNGRFCVTPEYPSGTYAYFVTINASGTPEYPYIIGPQYYGAPESDNIIKGKVITVPAGTTCFTSYSTSVLQTENKSQILTYPNPSSGVFNISLPDITGEAEVVIYDATGKVVYDNKTNSGFITVDLRGQSLKGIFILKVIDAGKIYTTKMVMGD
ncbi:MAG: YHYH protein [Bacteroidia bacterium]|nr:YHYH protein [Bacteroidia bacterium]